MLPASNWILWFSQWRRHLSRYSPIRYSRWRIIEVYYWWRPDKTLPSSLPDDRVSDNTRCPTTKENTLCRLYTSQRGNNRKTITNTMPSGGRYTTLNAGGGCVHGNLHVIRCVNYACKKIKQYRPRTSIILFHLWVRMIHNNDYSLPMIMIIWWAFVSNAIKRFTINYKLSRCSLKSRFNSYVRK